MTKQKKIICTHPSLRPTKWNEKKPKPWTGTTCECGTNWHCPVCGNGFYVCPCKCQRIMKGILKRRNKWNKQLVWKDYIL
jgi:hypothetical protein